MPDASIPLPGPILLDSATSIALSHSRYRPTARSRAGGIAFALGMIVLTFLVMWRMGAITLGEDRAKVRLVAINLSKPPPPQAAAGSAPKKAVAKVAPVVEPPRVLPPPVVKPKVEVPAIVRVSRSDMAAWDISKIKSADASSAAGGAGNGNGKLYGPGEAPGVGKLYNAEWYREPTRAELATYLPHDLHGTAWGMIACKTIENYHVEDCQELAESPPGSGLARGLRRAAWQLLVRPPRLDGKPLIGAWVRIKFTLTAAKTEAEQAEEVPGG